MVLELSKKDVMQAATARAVSIFVLDQYELMFIRDQEDVVIIRALFDWVSWNQIQSNYNGRLGEGKIPWRANERTQLKKQQTT